MPRVMCVWLPDWPLQRVAATQPALRSQPLVLFADRGPRGLCVTACSSAAAARGVAPGMRLAEAEGIWAARSRRGGGQPSFLRHDPEEDRTSLIRLAHWCQRFSPLVAIEGSDSLLLEISGCAHLFGGERGLMQRVAGDFRRCGLRVQVALADTPGAAWGVARYGMPSQGQASAHSASEGHDCRHRHIPGAEGCDSGSAADWACVRIVPPGRQAEALAPLPVEALRLPAEVVATLHELELRQVGQLWALPRAALPARFGPEVLARLDQALGEVSEPLAVIRPSPPVEACWSFPSPTADRRVLDSALSRLIRQVVHRLAPRREGVQRLEVRLEGAARQKMVFVVGTIQPTASARHLTELALTQLEQLRLMAEVHGVSVTAQGLSLLDAHQPQLFEGAQPVMNQRELSRLANRLSARLGKERVVHPALIPDPQPELAVRWEPVAGHGGERRADSEKRTVVECRYDQPSKRGTCDGTPCDIPTVGHSPVRPFGVWGWEFGVPCWPACARPLHLLAEPEPIRVVSVVPDGPPARFFQGNRALDIAACWGPERIESGWWRGEHVRRDYYRVETGTGQRFWLFRRMREGDWFLHGEFE